MLEHLWLRAFPDCVGLTLVAIVAMTGSDSLSIADVLDGKSVHPTGHRMPFITRVLDADAVAAACDLLDLL